MTATERELAREVRAMTRKEIIVKALSGSITWLQAAQILGISSRHVRRLRESYERIGVDAFVDHRGKTPRRSRIPPAVVKEVVRLKRDKYDDLNLTHFHEKLTEEHKVSISYTWTRHVLEAAGLIEKAPGRGRYRRQRERRPMRGMLIHMDASTHAWIPGLPKRDLVVTLDDATGEVLDIRMVEEEGTASTFAALRAVLTKYGRFGELYTDRGSHFRPTQTKDGEQADGQVARALKVLGVRQIFARSPQARGRSERMFQTIQGRLPQELKLAGIRSYDDPKLQTELLRFAKSINYRFAVKPLQPESAFVPLVKTPLNLVLSVKHERVVNHDHTVHFNRRVFQLPQGRGARYSYARCNVRVHEFDDGTFGVSHEGVLLASFDAKGGAINTRLLQKSA
jgi:transposase